MTPRRAIWPARERRGTAYGGHQEPATDHCEPRAVTDTGESGAIRPRGYFHALAILALGVFNQPGAVQ